MIYDPESNDRFRIWALKESSQPNGILPHADTTAKFLMTMELERLVVRSNIAPVWFITDAGREELKRLAREEVS